MLKRYRADRAFDDFNAGQEVELDPDDQQHARWIATGYLEPLEDADPDDEQDQAAANDEAAARVANTTTVPAAPTEEPPGVPVEELAGEAASAPAKRARRTRATEEPAGETTPAAE